MFATPRSLYQSHESIIDENGSFVKQVSNKWYEIAENKRFISNNQ